MFWPVFLLGFFSSLVLFLNYQPSTWLLGWDNLVPEFNFSLNLKRALFSAWQEYQGLGLAGGMAHGASLSREIILWPLSLFIPMSFIRYFWTGLMLIIGPIGLWFLTNFLLNQKDKHRNFQLASFIAGIFYLFNLATLQYFYPPFETFSGFFGFFPWLVFSSLKFLTTNNRKSAFKLLIISFLSTSAFQVQTMFAVYVLVMVTFLLNFIFSSGSFKKILGWIFITLIANLFWLIPVGYFTFFHSSTNIEAKQNQLATSEVILMNQNYGDWSDILSLRGYWFDYLDKNEDGNLVYLLTPWINYLDESLLWIIRGIVISGLLGSIVFSVSCRKKYFSWSLLLLWVLIFLLLTAGKEPLGFIYQFFEKHIPLFSQIFRTTFTKWSMAFVLVISIGLAVIFDLIYQKIFNWLKPVLVTLVAFLIVVPVFPFFQGQLIYQRMKVNLPAEYLQLFSFFDQQPKQSRIALLPAESVFGWDFYAWGYRGSGFLWYGIEQPLLSRAFDVFSKTDENFYHQFSAALRANDSNQIGGILDLYDVDYLFLDKNIVTNTGFIDYENLIKALSWELVFTENNLYVWQRPELSNSFVRVNSSLDFVSIDNSFQARLLPDYINHSIKPLNQEPFLELPFIDLTKQEIDSVDFHQNVVSFSRKISQTGKFKLYFPAWKEKDRVVVFAKLKLNDGVITIKFAPTARLRVAGQEFLLPSLGSYKIDYALGKNIEKVVLDINDQNLVLIEGKEIDVPFFDLVVGEPINLLVNEVIGGSEERGLFLKSGGGLNLEIDSNVWRDWLSESTFDFQLTESNQTITVDIPSFSLDLIDYLKFSENETNCDVFDRGNVKKKINDDSISYQTSEFGTFCESLKLTDIDTNYDFLVRVEGESFNGRSPKFLVTSATDNFTYLENLLSDKKFKANYLFLAQPFEKENYFINFEFKSFGEVLTEAKLNQLELFYLSLPIKSLSSLYLKPTNYQQFENETVIDQVSKFGTSFYKVNINVETTNGFIYLSQSFDKFWVALSFNNGLKIYPHYVYKNWANGWLVDHGQHQIYLIYLPQLLVLLSLFVLVVSLIILFPKKKKANQELLDFVEE